MCCYSVLGWFDTGNLYEHTRHCGICGLRSHDRRRCPMRNKRGDKKAVSGFHPFSNQIPDESMANSPSAFLPAGSETNKSHRNEAGAGKHDYRAATINGAAGDPSKLDYFLAALARGEPPQDDDEEKNTDDEEEYYDHEDNERGQRSRRAVASHGRRPLYLSSERQPAFLKPGFLLNKGPYLSRTNTAAELVDGESATHVVPGNPSLHAYPSTRLPPKCERCGRLFRSAQGLGAHRRTCKVRLGIVTFEDSVNENHESGGIGRCEVGMETGEDEHSYASGGRTPRKREPPFIPAWHVGLAAAPYGQEGYTRQASVLWLSATRAHQEERRFKQDLAAITAPPYRQPTAVPPALNLDIDIVDDYVIEQSTASFAKRLPTAALSSSFAFVTDGK